MKIFLLKQTILQLKQKKNTKNIFSFCRNYFVHTTYQESIFPPQ